MTLSVLMTTEGTYPYSAGGVSTWCDALLRNTPDVNYVLLPIMMNPHIETKFEPPANVRRVVNVPLWGIEEPAEFISDIPFASLFDRKRRTTTRTVEQHFLPLFSRFLEIVADPVAGAGRVGEVFVAMEDYFRAWDYNDTFKSAPVWDVFRRSMEETAVRRLAQQRLPEAEHQLPSLFDLTECLRWLYRFLIVLNVRVPRVSVTHSTAAAFCGIPCITARVRHGTPMLLTEHGVYLREQYLFLSRFRRLFFCKSFLLDLITTVVRANYHYADVIAPVCHYNTRWEVAHGVPQKKIRVLHNGVDPEVFTVLPKRVVPPHVVTTARIDPLKDIETLLRAAARVHQSHPGVRFTVAGAVADEAYYNRCLTLRHRLGLEDVVTMGAAVSDVVGLYGDADVVLLTSISEAFPYSVLEAMSCGKPVVASDVGGVGEALEGSGILVKPRDDEGFASAVRRLLDDVALRRQLGAAARARVLADFRLEHNILSHLTLYRDLAREGVAA